MVQPECTNKKCGGKKRKEKKTSWVRSANINCPWVGDFGIKLCLWVHVLLWKLRHDQCDHDLLCVTEWKQLPKLATFKVQIPSQVPDPGISGPWSYRTIFLWSSTTLLLIPLALFHPEVGTQGSSWRPVIHVCQISFPSGASKSPFSLAAKNWSVPGVRPWTTTRTPFRIYDMLSLWLGRLFACYYVNDLCFGNFQESGFFFSLINQE